MTTPKLKSEPFDQEGSLMKKTRELLNADNRDLFEIYAATKISFYWLKKFSKGEFDNPSVNRVQFLYEFLSGNKLSV